MERKTAPQAEKEMPPLGKAQKFLPIVMTSNIARNRLEQMKKQIGDVKMLNPTRFFPKVTPMIDPAFRKK